MTHKRNSLAVALLAISLASVSCCAGLPEPARPTQTPRPTYTLRPTYTFAAPGVLPTVTVPAPAQPPRAPANELEAQVEAVFRTAEPAVVNVTSRLPGFDFFMQSAPQEGTGSGFVYDRQGHIVTNYHVVEGAASVSVAFASGESYPAQVVGEDPSTDLAVLLVEVSALPDPLPLADSGRLRVGQFVVAIGNPFRLDRTLTLGIISALQRVIESPDGRFIGEAIQTDAAINPGNSGGPMLNLDGEVIGVNSQIISPSGAFAGIGFAVSSNTVARIVPELISLGRYPHPWLGVTIWSLTPEFREALDQAGIQIGAPEGLLVTEVVSGSPAERAGVRGGDRMALVSGIRLPVGGDIITAIDGQPVASGQDLTIYLDAETRVGDTVELTVVREGSEIQVAVTLGELPRQ
jgi:S1-C subfamily serine protease